MLTLTYALAAIAAQQKPRAMATRIENLLAKYNKVATIGNITQVTRVATSAANKALVINKVTRGAVLLFANALNYKACVQRSAAKYSENDGADVAAFEPSAASFTHSPTCYSIVINNNSAQEYLYAHFLNADSVYVMDGKLLTVEEVASYMAPAAAKALLAPVAPTLNVKHGIVHDLVVRTVKMENIVRLAALKAVIE